MSRHDTRYVSGATKLKTRLATIREGVGQIASASVIAELLLDRNLRRFDKEVDPEGMRWTELAPGTIRKKIRGGYPLNILKRTLLLRESIQVIRKRAGDFAIGTGAGISIGVQGEAVDRARVHQLGTHRVPRRRFLGISASDIAAVDSMLRRKLKKLVKG